MRRLISVGAVLSLFVLGAPIDGAAADTHVQEGPSEQGFGDDPLANPGRQRSAAAPAEPTGPPARAAARGIVNCGEVITKNTTLLRDGGPCPGNCIIIGADNITLNLNGHTVSGTPGIGDGNAAGIRLPFRTGVTVTGHPGNSGKTGTVTGFDAGVFINGGSGNLVENLVVRDKIGLGGDALLSDGIALFHSANNRIINNRVSRNGPFDGIGVLGVDSNDNLLQGNTVEETVGDASGNDLAGEGTGIILNNFLDEFASPRRGTPIFNNHVLSNVVRRNSNSGISNVTHVGGRIEGNIGEDNGALGEVCERNRLRDGTLGPVVCRPAAAPSNGIGVTTGPGAATKDTRMLITNNQVTGNTGDGIAIGAFQFARHAFRNEITGNVATGNGGSGNNFSRPFDGPFGRYDLHDFSFGDGRRPEPSCDNNVWLDNVFNTAFPPCAAGGLATLEGPVGGPSCTDSLDNDLDGVIDGGDPDCMALPPPPPPLDGDGSGERPRPEPGGALPPPEPGGELPPPPSPPP